MVKNASGSSGTGQTKAGKKSGSYVEPPAPNLEKKRLREMGNQQFVAKEYPRSLPNQKGTWEYALDGLCAAFGVKRIRTRQESDNGYRWDEARKNWVSPPLKEAVSKNA